MGKISKESQSKITTKTKSTIHSNQVLRTSSDYAERLESYVTKAERLILIRLPPILTAVAQMVLMKSNNKYYMMLMQIWNDDCLIIS